jgi:hypothetical protein
MPDSGSLADHPDRKEKVIIALHCLDGTYIASGPIVSRKLDPKEVKLLHKTSGSLVLTS